MKFREIQNSTSLYIYHSVLPKSVQIQIQIQIQIYFIASYYINSHKL